jgi:signal transduction histidine kinase
MTRKVPTLRRRLAQAFALVAVAGFLALSAAVYTVVNVWLSTENPGFGACFQLPFLPHTGSCGPPGYSPPVRFVLGVLLLAGLLLAGWGCWRLAARLLRPLSDMAATVGQLGPQNPGERIRMTGDADPLKELADAVDAALDRLVAGYESQRRFASNASHELRTQLAVQRLLTEVAMDDPDSGPDLHRLGGQLIRANERNEMLIEGLLMLAESERGLPGKVPVRLDELTASVLNAHAELAATRGVSLRRALAERLVPGDPVLLERLISNLIINAIMYNQPDGWVEVTVSATQPALTVRNTGQDIPAAALPVVFEPFRRLAADRTDHRGAGLGLSIVRAITVAHDGAIHARPRDGGGLIIEIELPSTY